METRFHTTTDRKRPILTLTTDFGSQDGFAGILKGVVWSICPEAQIADISHAIPPQDILAGALMLGGAYSFFPAGTIHLAVVDPGVGTSRRPIAARLGEHFFVGPDNGLFTPMILRVKKLGGACEIVHLTNPRYFQAKVSRTFHGRDVFAPVAAYLANGVPLSELGGAINDPLCISLPQAKKIPGGWKAHVTGVDTFGNCTTDLPAGAVKDRNKVTFRLRGHEVRGLVDSYGQRCPGEFVALVNSSDFVELAVVNGSAANLTGAQAGEVVEVVE